MVDCKSWTEERPVQSPIGCHDRKNTNKQTTKQTNETNKTKTKKNWSNSCLHNCKLFDQSLRSSVLATRLDSDAQAVYTETGYGCSLMMPDRRSVFFPSNARWLSPGRLTNRKYNCIWQIQRIRSVATSVLSTVCNQKRTDWIDT